ncbi:MAG TPA: ABC transporter permease [Pseudoalteromonas sp.]|uniref:ABC3 transporter permease protein domain-containing protein n=1 Tax=marine sediment metagenome TaxID=412755 RepID=A0A0F9SXC4_9ZZZZ|nr:ABC transporter permease [Pseudoalteromonas sp.]HDZ32079.1 ABC transporter permease [Pseudoalteromonas sp.]
MLVSLAWSSLASRRKSVILTFLSLLISISVLLSVEHIRQQAKESFNRTISDVDMIVGAPSGQLNLLLYSVFRMGSPTSNINYKSFETLKGSSLVKWAIPISLGDSHRGFRVMGTNNSYFEHFKYGTKQPLTFSRGQPFNALFEAVIGSDVAKKLSYKIDDSVVIAHGIGNTSFTHHDNTPFIIKGILSPTGTPVDKTIHVSLNAIEAIHLSPVKQAKLLNNVDSVNTTPESITAVMLGLKSKFSTFKLQRDINNYKADRLMAVLPGVAMSELWQMMATVENLLRVIGILVLVSSLFGLSTMLLASMAQRKNEIAVLRVLGAGPSVIFSLVLVEALILVILASAAATALLSLTIWLLGNWLGATYGLFLNANMFNVETLKVIAVITVAATITSAIPAYEAYKNALHSSLGAKS